MNDDTLKVLNLMFRSKENVCVSPNKYGHHSIPLSSFLSGRVNMMLPSFKDENDYSTYDSGQMILMALNPITGWRSDEKCTAYRNFLIEMDSFEKDAQIEYIKRLQVPYSAMIWSGSKSVHTLISLDTDLRDEKAYRILSEWMLRIVALADQKTKNPSRSIRIPGAIRPETSNEQTLIEFRGPVKLADLVEFLKKHPDARPKVYEKKEVSEDVDLFRIKRWARKRLRKGLKSNQGRNNQWYAIAYEFALSGYSEDDTIGYLEKYFSPDRDFKEKEWLISIRSAFKTAYNKGPTASKKGTSE